MSQGQPLKPHQEPVKYGDVFPVQGQLAEMPVAPMDAAIMQHAEGVMLGSTQKGGAAAAASNESIGLVCHGDRTHIPGQGGVSIMQTKPPEKTIITESIGGQVVAEYSQPVHPAPSSSTEQVGGGGGITIGEALEAAALTAGQKPVERSDAAAIQAAEVRASGHTSIIPGGVAAAAQSAATHNAKMTGDENKTKLADVLANATSKLPADKPATRKDAEGVAGAEMRNNPLLTTHPTGVAASIAAAARLNQNQRGKTGQSI